MTSVPTPVTSFMAEKIDLISANQKRQIPFVKMELSIHVIFSSKLRKILKAEPGMIVMKEK